MAHLSALMPQTEPFGGSAAPNGESSMALLNRLQRGDGEALASLVQRYMPPLLRWARGRVPHWACDNAGLPQLVRDALIDAFQRLPTSWPLSDAAIQALMREALRRRITDELRHRVEGAPQAASGSDAALPPSPVEQAIGADGIEQYEAALADLSPKEREAVIGRIELGLTYQELAVALGLSAADGAREAVLGALLHLAQKMSVMETTKVRAASITTTGIADTS